MHITVTERKENPILSRQDVRLDIAFEQQTPSRLELRKELAKNLKADEACLVITQVTTTFGFRTAKGTAHLYKDAESLARHEPTYIKARNGPKKQKGEG